MVAVGTLLGNDTMADHSSNLGVGVFGVILTIWIIVSNSALIISILMDDVRRRSIFCLHIVNLAVADLLVGVVVVPIMADYLLGGSWDLGEDVCQFWLISDVLLCTVSIIALVMISCDRFMYLTCPRMFLEHSRYIVCCLMIILPWVVGMALVLPLWIMGKGEIKNPENDCMLLLRQDYKISSLFVSFFVPAFLAIGVNVAILLMLFVLRQRLGELPLKRKNENPKRQIFCVCIVSVVFTVMWAPFFVVSLLMAVGEYKPPRAIITLTIWMGYCNSGVNPLLWLVFPQVREGFRALLCCCRRGEEEEEDDSDEVDEDEARRSMMDDNDEVFELKDTET
ncbi:beta-4C adrenergic receptor-like [Haliotis cracherodii]|uniref:beta-4C adrenergic receptor-like n=1 Tax=Haliotis cracherodii TaxID=6455 RepID=UPI0039ED51FB